MIPENSPSGEATEPRAELPLPVLTGAGRPASKLREAFALFRSNFALFSVIVLTVWLPGNLLLNYLSYHVYGPEDVLNSMHVSLWIESLFGPIYIGALIYAFSRIAGGSRVGYAEAMKAGLRSWGRLFAARLVAGVYILLGLIALIVPGVVLMVRYALVDNCVVLEGAAPKQAMRHSMDLTRGRGLRIFFAGTLFWAGYMAIGIALYIPLSSVQPLGNMFAGAMIDSVLSVLYALFYSLLFVYYREARQEAS